MPRWLEDAGKLALQGGAGRGRRGDDQGEGDGEEVEAGERRRGEQVQRPVAECPPADAQDRFGHDGDHHRLDTVQEPGDRGDLGVRRHQPAQEQEHEDRWNDEERPGHDAAGRPVHQPADVDGGLLGLRTRQEHAEVEGPQELLFRDPAPPFDDLPVHEGDLPGRAAEVDEAEADPEAQGLAESRHAVRLTTS
jgi:hypothetical protein